MPTYQYKCNDCGVAFERFQHFSEEPVRVCPECDGVVRRVIHPVGIIFKGSGFYVTDNKKSTALTSRSEPSEPVEKKEAKADSPATDTPKAASTE
jgi:putative FmdB family regulatory protein